LRRRIKLQRAGGTNPKIGIPVCTVMTPYNTAQTFSGKKRRWHRQLKQNRKLIGYNANRQQLAR